MARVHAHPRSMGPKMDSLLYAILGFLLRNRFVSPLWIRQTDTQGRGSPFRHACSLINYACFPASSPSFSLFQRPLSPPSWRNEMPRLRSWKLKPNPTAIKEGPTERKTALERTGRTTIRLRNQNVVSDRYVMEDSRPVRTSILTLSISDGLSYRCEKTRFSEISSFRARHHCL
jgi:hypothetical protein